MALLTDPELDVLSCLMDGLSRSEIASVLHVPPITVRADVQSILHKLNVHSTATAVALPRRAGVTSAREYKMVRH